MFEIEDIQRGDKYIIVHYKGKVYRREMSIIGRKLFLLDANLDVKLKANNGTSVKIGSIVETESRNGLETFKICGIESGKLYTQMGGSYYGAKVVTITVGKHIKNKTDNMMYLQKSSATRIFIYFKNFIQYRIQ